MQTSTETDGNTCWTRIIRAAKMHIEGILGASKAKWSLQIRVDRKRVYLGNYVQIVTLKKENRII